MSTTEVPRKRGRPRKVVDESAEGKVEVKTTTTRKASTKITAKGTKAGLDIAGAAKKTAAKANTVKASAAKTVKSATAKTKPTTTAKTTRSSSEEATTSKTKTPITPAKQITLISTPTSKIIQEVLAKAAFKAPVSETPSSATEPTQPPSSTPPSNPASQKQREPSPSYGPLISIPPPSLKHAPQPYRAPVPKRAPSALPESSPYAHNPGSEAAAQYVHNGRLPPKYKPAAWRVTAIIIALPVILVTSWELYDRFANQRGAKELPKMPNEKGEMVRYVPGAGSEKKEEVWR